MSLLKCIRFGCQLVLGFDIALRVLQWREACALSIKRLVDIVVLLCAFNLWRDDDRGGAETTLSLGKVVPICSGLRTMRARVTETLSLGDIGMSE